MDFAIPPPIEPMLAKLAEELPDGGDLLYEPKWDGFRAIVFRGASDLYIQSRDSRPLDRYFPELHDALLDRLPPGCVVDGEIVIATPHGLDFNALQLRLHPAASRVAKLAKEQPSAFVAFDLLAVDHAILRQARDERVVQLGKVAVEGPRVAALDVHLGRAAEHDGAEPVPFWLVQVAACGQLVGQLRQHRLDRGIH